MALFSKSSEEITTNQDPQALRKKTRWLRGETRETLTGIEQQIQETLAMAGGTAQILVEQREQMDDVQKNLDQTKLQAHYAEKQLDRLSWWHFTGKRGNQQRARKELKRRGPARDRGSGKYRTKHDLEATRKARAARTQQKKERAAHQSRTFGGGLGLFARAAVEKPTSQRSAVLKQSPSSSTVGSDGGSCGGGRGSWKSRKTSLKERIARGVIDDTLLNQGLGALGESETVVLEDEEEQEQPYPPSSFMSGLSVLDPGIVEIRHERHEHDQAVESSLDEINSGVETLMAVGRAMNVELRRHSELLEGIQESATEVTAQTELNNTRAARFLRCRY